MGRICAAFHAWGTMLSLNEELISEPMGEARGRANRANHFAGIISMGDPDFAAFSNSSVFKSCKGGK